jgi:hypothetical protein
VKTWGQPRRGWAAVLRRRPARMVEGRPEGGYTDVFEVICCDCGDHPYLDYREVSPELQRIRGPYPMEAGLAAYEKHIGLHHQPSRASSMAR